MRRSERSDPQSLSILLGKNITETNEQRGLDPTVSSLLLLRLLGFPAQRESTQVNLSPMLSARPSKAGRRGRPPPPSVGAVSPPLAAHVGAAGARPRLGAPGLLDHRLVAGKDLALTTEMGDQ